MIAQAFLLTGVSPYEVACCACAFGVEMYCIHLQAQFGCFALDGGIQVSSQPVTPSLGITVPTFAFAATSCEYWYGQEAPRVDPPFLKRSIWSDASAQYCFTSGRCCLSRATAAASWVLVSSYGSVIPRLGFVFDRYSAASAIWIGLSGIVILPLFFGS